MTTPDEKADPSVTQMRLRTQPKPVLRLSRKMLIGAGAVCSVALAAALAFAITPQKPVAAPAAGETTPTHRPPTSEALNNLPKDYTGVPKLGPPLPGDFGRPMLAAAQSNDDRATTTSPGFPSTTMPAPSTAPAYDQQAQQAQQAHQSARNSQLFFPQAVTTTTDASPQIPLATPLADLAAWASPTATQPRTTAERQQAFLDRIADEPSVSAARLTEPASPYLLLTGSVVPAALITGIRSDVPGQVLAQVTEDIRDSVSGQYLLVPKGSRLIGQYDNAISFGQSRILLVWSRLILPSGKSIRLDNQPAADARGFAGLQDTTDFHWAGIINAAAVSTLLGMGAQSGNTASDSDLVRAIRDGAGDSVNRAGQAIVERQLTIQPTIRIRPGLPVRVILTRDLVLEPYGE